MKLIDQSAVNELIAAADASPRRRAHLRLHPTLADPIQRMVVVFNTGTYVQPHRHSAERWELFAVLQGRAVCLCFDNHGRVLERIELDAQGPNHLVEIGAGAWHSITALEDHTLMLETKPGPYVETSDKDFATWAPAENQPGWENAQRWFTQCSVGDMPPWATS